MNLSDPVQRETLLLEVPPPPALSEEEGLELVETALEALRRYLLGESPEGAAPVAAGPPGARAPLGGPLVDGAVPAGPPVPRSLMPLVLTAGEVAGGLHGASPCTAGPPAGGLLDRPAGAFVSVYVGSELRGCIGLLAGEDPLSRAVENMAIAAATRDPRFEPVLHAEYGTLSLEISVLGPLAPLPPSSPELWLTAIRPGEHGLSIKHQGKSGILLPQVASRYGWDSHRLLAETSKKAGLAPNAWRESGAQLWAFRSAIFSGRVEAGGPEPTAEA